MNRNETTCTLEMNVHLSFEQHNVEQRLKRASKLPFALNRHRERFNICWAKSRTPVLLFLLLRRTRTPFVLVTTLLLSATLSRTSLFTLLRAPSQPSQSTSGATYFAKGLTRPPITHLVIYSGANQSSCFEADPEGCGFYPWLVIVAVSSGPK